MTNKEGLAAGAERGPGSRQSATASSSVEGGKDRVRSPSVLHPSSIRPLSVLCPSSVGGARSRQAPQWELGQHREAVPPAV